jgi:hypothetical protein
MTGGTLTASHPFGLQDGGYLIRSGTIAASVDALPDHASSTRRLAEVTRGAMLPLLVGIASVGSAPTEVLRVFSDAAISQSGAMMGSPWLLDLDGFVVTRESADAAEVRALNALLSLPVTTGLELDLPE